ncbi:hypothetical protein ACU4GD_30865 [Cupriavidus basilensis]
MASLAVDVQYVAGDLCPARFTQLSGETPLQLVTTLRMEMAARLLTQDRDSRGQHRRALRLCLRGGIRAGLQRRTSAWGRGAFRREARERRAAAAVAAADTRG